MSAYGFRELFEALARAAAPRPAGRPPAQAAADWMTVQEAAAALALSACSVHRLLSLGYLESCKADDGWRRLVSAESVRAELARRDRAREGIRPPYAAAASVYRAETRRRLAAYCGVYWRPSGYRPIGLN